MKRVLLVDYEYRANKLVKSVVFGAPSVEQKWVIVFWAKQGTFTHELTIDCAEVMHADEFIPFVSKECDKFIDQALVLRDKYTLALRLEGKKFNATRIEQAVCRYGYRAYYEEDKDET